MRLIDVDAVMRNNLFTERDRGFLLDAPTIDAVEVVRCEDCKHRREDCGMGDHRWCDSLRMSTRADDFCSYGERIEP